MHEDTNRCTERGVALVVALLMMLIVTMLGTGLTVASRSAIHVGTSFTNQQLAFQAAEAGLEHARELLRLERYNAGLAQPNFDVQLDRVANGETVLIASNDLSNFGTTNGFAKDGAIVDLPVQPPTNLFGASYQVFLTNDPAETACGGTTVADRIACKLDSDNSITLTAFGSGPNGVGFAALQGVYDTIFKTSSAPNVPGLITLLGPDVQYSGPTSNRYDLDGDAGLDSNGNPVCYPSIATTSNAARDRVRAEIASLTTKKQDNFHTCNPTLGGPEITGGNSVINYINNDPNFGGNASANPFQAAPRGSAESNLAGQATTTPPELLVSYWTDLVANLTSTADFTSSSDPGFTLGNSSNPKVVVINGDFAMSNSDCPHNNPCAGILLVRGDFTANGGPAYDGVVYVVGSGNVVRNGGGTGSWCGGMIVADINNPTTIAGVDYVGEPNYTHNGGGNSAQGVCNFNRQGGGGEWGTALRRLSFQQLRDS